MPRFAQSAAGFQPILDYIRQAREEADRQQQVDKIRGILKKRTDEAQAAQDGKTRASESPVKASTPEGESTPLQAMSEARERSGMGENMGTQRIPPKNPLQGDTQTQTPPMSEMITSQPHEYTQFHPDPQSSPSDPAANLSEDDLLGLYDPKTVDPNSIVTSLRQARTADIENKRKMAQLKYNSQLSEQEEQDKPREIPAGGTLYNPKTGTKVEGEPRVSSERSMRLRALMNQYGEEEGLNKWYEEEKGLREASASGRAAGRAPNIFDAARKAILPGKAGKDGKKVLRIVMEQQGKKGEVLRTEKDGTVVYGLPADSTQGIPEVILDRKKPAGGGGKKPNAMQQAALDELNRNKKTGADSDDVRARAKQYLEGKGMAGDDENIDVFLKNNPHFK